MQQWLARLVPAAAADRVVPPTGLTATLTMATAAAMAFLAVFALALSLAAGRVAERWSDALSRGATIRISAPADQVAAQTQAVITILQSTPGVAESRAFSVEETKALLQPWFGPDLPVDSLPLPQLIEIRETGGGTFDPEALRLRLTAEAPGAVLDDHLRWRRPLAEAAGRLRFLGGMSLLLIGGVMAAMITLAAQAALSANGQVLRVLRLIGAQDRYIARAFVRRYTLRALAGAAMGTFVGVVAIAVLPAASEQGGFLTGLGFHGLDWLWPLTIPPLAALVGFWATRRAAFRVLRDGM
jgi:cell division transport system permease protein